MSSLPPDIIDDILCRLEVKDLLRFRCVSKPWCSLIDSPDFINLHLSHSIKTNTHLFIILRALDLPLHLYSINYDSLDSVVKLDHPLEDEDGGTEILGSCNGLVALSNSMEDIGLWNPSTRKSHKLPVSDIEFPECFPICPIVVYGFGYDSVSDDYKLVRIAEFLGEDDHYVDSEVKVYSLKKKCWKRVKGFPYLLHYKRIYGVLVNNALHFVVSRRSESYAKSLIAAFDLGTEETYEVPLLDLWAEEFYYMLLGVLEGSLCMIANYENSRVDIWVMKEYGVKDSWTKLLSVVDPQGSFSYDFIKMKPLVYSRSKDRVLVNQDGEKFIWYDLTAKGAEDVKIQGLSKTFEAEMFVGSLVKLDGNFLIRGINRKNQQANRGKKKRDDFLSVGFKLKL